MHVTNDDTWKIEYTKLKPEQLVVEESLFALGNGYLGVRGNLEEHDPLYKPYPWPTIRGTYLNGFYDDVPITYDEKAYGFPESKQKMVNLPDAQTILIQIGEEWGYLDECELIDYKRTLDLKQGFSERFLYLKTPSGYELQIVFRRLVSFAFRELFAQEVTVMSTNYEGPISFHLVLNGDVENYVAKDDPRLASGHAKILRIIQGKQIGNGVLLQARTLRSQLDVFTYMTAWVNVPYEETIEWKQTRFEWVITCRLGSGGVTLYKQNFYADSLRYEKPEDRLVECARDLKEVSFERLVQHQAEKLSEFYRSADITILGHPALQEGIRFNLFHLFQAVGRDRYSNMAAKGLSGEGYEGHYFWDTEIYILPVFMTTLPDIAKGLLLYRYYILDDARQHARIMGHRKGALYPWRTIKGTECSSYFPAGSAQYHINADIGYSFIQYYLATGDEAFLFQYGAEVIFETARLFLDVGHYHDGAFHIFCVTGPDEYTALVNDNFYTNAMAKYHLNWAAKIYDFMKEKNPEALRQLKEKIQLTEEEVRAFQTASSRMALLFDEERNIHMQDDSFLRKPLWKFDETPKDHYPLLLHYHPLVIYRHQVCKQPDVVLAYFLLDDFPLDIMKASYNYYEAITTHDSSLSSCIYSIMAARIGDVEKAYQYFLKTARTDLDNTHKNTKDGLHMANMGGTYLALVYGFAGVRIKEQGLTLRPQLPQAIEQLTLSLNYRGRTIRIDMSHRQTEIALLSGEPLSLFVYDEVYLLAKHQPIVVNRGGQ